MFWGLIVEPRKKYSQTIKNSFHISMASLELKKSEPDEYVTLILDFEGQQEYVLCHLNKRTKKQQNLDLNFRAGQSISVFLIGSSRIHLTGYLLGEDIDGDNSSSSGSEDCLESEEDDSYEMKLHNGRDDNITLPDSEKKSSYGSSNQKKTVIKNQKNLHERSDEDFDEPPVKPVQKAKPQKGKVEPKAANQQPPNQSQQNNVPKKSSNNKKGSKQKRTLEGGLVVEDLEVGHGQLAVNGKKVGIYHVARFPRGRKILYETEKGLPFTFRLGNSEVIKGWDMGIVGMRVGGKRRITVPPHLAFGKKVVIPQIPPNSTVVYDVELKSVKS